MVSERDVSFIERLESESYIENCNERVEAFGFDSVVNSAETTSERRARVIKSTPEQLEARRRRERERWDKLTPEERAQKTQHKRERRRRYMREWRNKCNRINCENPEQCLGECKKKLTSERREAKRLCDRRRWSNLTSEQREQRRQHKREWRSKITPERLEVEKLLKREYRSKLTPEKSEAERQQNRKRWIYLSPEQRKLKVAHHREWSKKRKLSASNGSSQQYPKQLGGEQLEAKRQRDRERSMKRTAEEREKINERRRERYRKLKIHNSKNKIEGITTLQRCTDQLELYQNDVNTSKDEECDDDALERECINLLEDEFKCEDESELMLLPKTKCDVKHFCYARQIEFTNMNKLHCIHVSSVDNNEVTKSIKNENIDLEYKENKFCLENLKCDTDKTNSLRENAIQDFKKELKIESQKQSECEEWSVFNIKREPESNAM